MHQNIYQPLTFGRLLDRSFRLYRQHFAKFMLLTLLLFGPFYLVYGWVFADTISTGFSFTGYWGAESWTTETTPEDLAVDPATIGGLLFFVLIMMPVMLFVLTPMALSSGVQLVKSAYDGEELHIGGSIKRTLRRFWPLLGNSVLFSLMIFGIYIGMAIGIVIIVMIFAVILGLGGALTGGFDPGLGFVFGAMLLYIGVIFVIFAALGFFIIRWGYFVPAVVLEGEGVGFGRSWSLTKGSFWRLLFVYFVLSIVISIFNIVFTYANTLIPIAFLQVLLPVLITLLLVPLYLTTYGVSYWDMKIRREGYDLEQRLQDQWIPPGEQGFSDPNGPSGPTGAGQ